MYILIKQKRAWKFYADKRKMRYHSTALFETPVIDGVVDGYSVSMFASEHSELDARSKRRLTAIEVNLQTALPFSVAAASGGMVHVVSLMDLRQEYKPNIKGWDDSYVLQTNNLKMAQEYLNEDRLLKISNLMKIDKAWIIFLFIEDEGILRLDTPLPIANPKKIDVLIKQLINVAKALELKKGEDKDIIRQSKRKDQAEAVLEIDEDILDDDIGLELEDEEADLDNDKQPKIDGKDKKGRGKKT